jgi:hypothetical protein
MGSNWKGCVFNRIPRLSGDACLRVLLGVWILAAGARAEDGAPALRLAILSDTASEACADLLTAALSEEDGVHLLDREALLHVAEEHGLRAWTRAENSLKVGRLLGAQAILVLVEEEDAGGDVHRVWRLVATDTGVIVASGYVPRDSVDPESWMPVVRPALRRARQKAAVPVRDAVPVSLTRIRWLTVNHQTEHLERALGGILRRRLMTEPRLFVLERWRLEDLAWEKALAQAQQPFWTGSFVLEGQVLREPQAEGMVRMEMRLIAPTGETHTRAEACPETDWGEAVDRIVRWVAATAADRHEGEWSAVAEAALFHREALAAEQAGMFREARDLVEAACALTEPGLAMHRDRLRIYSRFMDGGKYSSLSSGSGVRLIPHVYDYHHSDWNPPSWHERADLALRQMELYLGLMEHPPAGAHPRHTTDLFLFIAPSRVLFDAADPKEPARHADPRLPPLRELLRRASSLHEDIVQDAEALRPFRNIKAAYGPLWMETPEEGVRLLKEVFEATRAAPQPSDFIFCAHFDRGRGLATWNPGDREQAPGLMRAFGADLLTHTNASLRVLGRILRYYWSDSEEDAKRLMAEDLQTLDGRLGDDLIASMASNCTSDSVCRLFAHTIGKRGFIFPLSFLVRFYENVDNPQGAYEIFSAYERIRDSRELTEEEKESLRPAIRGFLERLYAHPKGRHREVELSLITSRFMKSPGLPGFLPPSRARPLPPPAYDLSGSEELLGLLWDNGRMLAAVVRDYRNDRPPAWIEMASEGATPPPGGWPPPWNGAVRLHGFVCANERWRVASMPPHIEGKDPDHRRARIHVARRPDGAWREAVSNTRLAPSSGGAAPVALSGDHLWWRSARGEVSILNLETGVHEVKYNHRRKSDSPLEACSEYGVEVLHPVGEHLMLIGVTFYHPADVHEQALFCHDSRTNQVRTLVRGHGYSLYGDRIVGIRPAARMLGVTSLFTIDPETGEQHPLLVTPDSPEASPPAVPRWTVPRDYLPHYLRPHRIPLYVEDHRLMALGTGHWQLGGGSAVWIFDDQRDEGSPVPLGRIHHAIFCPRGLLVFLDRDITSRRGYFLSMDELLGGPGASGH